MEKFEGKPERKSPHDHGRAMDFILPNGQHYHMVDPTPDKINKIFKTQTEQNDARR